MKLLIQLRLMKSFAHLRFPALNFIFHRVRLPKFIFVTERVRAFIQNNDIFLTEFVRPEDLQPKTEIDKRLFNKEFSPGRLSRWMPDERAHQLGDPLGIY